MSELILPPLSVTATLFDEGSAFAPNLLLRSKFVLIRVDPWVGWCALGVEEGCDVQEIKQEGAVFFSLTQQIVESLPSKYMYIQSL